MCAKTRIITHYCNTQTQSTLSPASDLADCWSTTEMLLLLLMIIIMLMSLPKKNSAKQLFNIYLFLLLPFSKSIDKKLNLILNVLNFFAILTLQVKWQLDYFELYAVLLFPKLTKALYHSSAFLTTRGSAAINVGGHRAIHYLLVIYHRRHAIKEKTYDALSPWAKYTESFSYCLLFDWNNNNGLSE